MLKVERITYAYRRAGGAALENVGFDLPAGHCIAVLGNNGAGKSTLLKCIDRIHPVQDGVVIVDGKDVFSMGARVMAHHLAYVPQNAGTADLTVFDAVLLGRRPYVRWDVTAEDREIAADVLHRMGLDGYWLRKVSELSGGEAQKVAIARALAQRPRVLLLDEPTSNLDLKNQHEVLRVVAEIARADRICAVIILHDLNLAGRYCDRFLFLKDARVFRCGGPEVLTEETIEAVYGIRVKLLDCDGVPVVVPCPDITEQGGIPNG